MSILNVYVVQNIFLILFIFLLFFSIIDILPLKRGLPQIFTFYFPCFVLIILTLLRNYGFSRDDMAYLEIYKNIESKGFDETYRDIGYLYILKFLNYFFEFPNVFQYLSTLFLSIKLLIIKKITINRNLSIVILLYISQYWQIHDLTQFRVSAAITFFLLFYFFTIRNFDVLRILSIITAISMHLQSIVYIPLLIKKTVISNKNLRVIMALSIFLAIILNITNIEYSFVGLLETSFENFWGFKRIETYIIMMNQGDFAHYKKIPFMLIATLMVMYWLSGENDLQGTPGWCIVSNSILLAVFLSFIFIGLTDVQVRVYEQLLFVSIIMAGKIKKTISKIAIIMLSILYFYKFNISWSIFNFY